MAREIIPIKDWQDRMVKHFSHNGELGGNLHPLWRQEHAAGDTFLEKYHGHRHLSLSSQSFALETLSNVDNEVIINGMNVSGYFQVLFVDFLMLFRRIRSANILAEHGYMGPGYALLRDICDKTIQLSAMFQGMVTYDDLMGIDKNDNPKATPEELKNLQRRRRSKLEKELVDHFCGMKSGLDKDDIQPLLIWKSLFDRETHGSFVSSTIALLAWVKEHNILSAVDNDDEMLSAMLINRINEVSWMFHRILPHLQTDPNGFGEQWSERWQVLDDSFWRMQMGLAGINKKIGEAFIRFLDAKFPFNPSTRFK